MLFISACTPGGYGTDPSGKNTFTVGGTVNGLSGSGLVLQNNGGDDLSISANGTFAFAAEIANGASYAVTVKTEPAGQTCAVDNGSGTVAGANVTNVSVTCTANTWETLSSLSASPAFSDFTPTGKSVLYTGSGSLMQKFAFPTIGNPQGVFTTLTSPPDSINNYIGFAWVGGNLFMVDGNTVYAYSITGDSWTKPMDDTLTYGHSDSQATADDHGFVYSLSGSHQLLKYNTTNNTYEYIATPSDLSTSEPRAAWDSQTKLVYLADYDNPDGFYAFNPVDGTFTALASLPDSAGMSDAFCSDRRGHIFTADGDGSSHAFWMYTAATDTWTSFPALPYEHGNNSSCTVSADGWLYFSDNGQTNIVRIKVF